MAETIEVPDTAPEAVVKSFDPAANDTPEKVIVIGSGPAGIRFAEELLKRRPNASITVFGNEPYQPYNRVQLSALLAGEIAYDDILTSMPDEKHYPGFEVKICAARNIDTESKTITDANGDLHSYGKLVIATGSRPHLPNIPGVEQTGVYTFRNLKDTEALYARVNRARHIVVVGGGLLGLEAARALLRQNTKVTLIQQGPRLMNRQLDDKAAKILQNKVEALGINVITESGVGEIHGKEGRVTGVTTRSGEHVDCDTVLVCAGIKPNLEIARNAQIKVGRGIVVDDQLKTSADDVYAIGECCEHRGLTYGLVNPGYEQAAILADLFARGKSNYIGSLEVSRLKVVGENVCSMGMVTDLPNRPFQKELSYGSVKKGVYRKIVLHKGHLIGAAGIGDWPEARRIQEAYQGNRKIWPWQRLWFLLSGKLWGFSGEDSVVDWPRTTVVCQCNNISQGDLVDAIAAGYSTAPELQKFTSAGTVCGSCKPLLAELCGNSGKSEKEKAWIPALAGSLLATCVIAALVFLPPLMVADSVLEQPAFEKIWNDKFWKQVTGFSLLGMSIVGLAMSLKKRLGLKKLGDFAWWRILHIFLGLMCAATLILHTGLHFGANLNRMLMIDFIAVILLGSIAGGVISLSHTFGPKTSRTLRKFWTWTHILVTWPLPILLGTHILTVYYF